MCETEVSLEYGQRALLLRPGLIVGAQDPSDRFTYWVDRIAKGGTVLAPGDPNTGVQFIDGLSLARFTIQSLEQNLSGTYNLNGQAISMQQVLETIGRVVGSQAKFVWADQAFLEQHKVNPWMGADSLPLWIPDLDAMTDGTVIQAALKAGLEFRSLEATVQEVLEWSATRENHTWRSGISEEREAELLSLLEQK